MSKLNIIKTVLTAIQESCPPVADESINSDCGQEDSEKVDLMTETADEQAIKELLRDFARTLVERDFEHLDSRAEYSFYTVDRLIELIKENDEQKTIKLFNENEIKSKYEDCEFVSIAFSEDQEQAKVVYNVIVCMLSADNKYFKELNKKNNKKNKISKGIPFSTTYTLLVKKEKGIWKVDKFQTSSETIKVER